MGKLDVGRPVDVWLKPQKALKYKKICMVAEAAEPTPAVPLHRDNCENMQSPAGTRASNTRRVNRSTPTKSKSPIGGSQLATGATPPKNIPNSMIMNIDDQPRANPPPKRQREANNAGNSAETTRAQTTSKQRD